MSKKYLRVATVLYNLLTCSSIFICFCKQQLILAEINHVIYFSQQQLLFAKTNEDRITSWKTIYSPTGIRIARMPAAYRPRNEHNASCASVSRSKLDKYMIVIKFIRQRQFYGHYLVLGQHLTTHCEKW